MGSYDEFGRTSLNDANTQNSLIPTHRLRYAGRSTLHTQIQDLSRRWGRAQGRGGAIQTGSTTFGWKNLLCGCQILSESNDNHQVLYHINELTKPIFMLITTLKATHFPPHVRVLAKTMLISLSVVWEIHEPQFYVLNTVKYFHHKTPQHRLKKCYVIGNNVGLIHSGYRRAQVWNVMIWNDISNWCDGMILWNNGIVQHVWHSRPMCQCRTRWACRSASPTNHSRDRTPTNHLRDLTGM